MEWNERGAWNLLVGGREGAQLGCMLLGFWIYGLLACQ